MICGRGKKKTLILRNIAVNLLVLRIVILLLTERVRGILKNNMGMFLAGGDDDEFKRDSTKRQ